MRLFPILLLIGCDYSVEQLCAGKGPVEVVLGQGTGADFEPFVAGEDIFITEAPQGGFGVTARASTTGLVTGAAVDVTLSSYLDGEPIGTFEWGYINLYCQDDGSGLLWGAVVPFDPDRFPDREALQELDGETITLELEAVDAAGDVGVGQVDVTVHLREQ